MSVLVLRQIPAVLLLPPLLEPLRRTKDVLFLGWFGPIGAALYCATHVLQETGIEEVWTVGSFVIVVAHGITDTPLTKLYGRFPRGEPNEERVRTRV